MDKNKKNILHTAIFIIVVCLSFICMGTYAYFTQDRTHIGGTVKTGEFPQEAILEGEPEKASPSEAPKMMLMAAKASPSDTGEEAEQNAEKAAQEGAAAGPDEQSGPGEEAASGEEAGVQSGENADDTSALGTSSDGSSSSESPADSAAEPPADNAAGAFEGALSASPENISGEESSTPPDTEVLTVEPLDF